MIQEEELSAEYVDHMGNDVTVVNAARQSFSKSVSSLGESDIGLIRYLATGLTSEEWETLLTEIHNLAVINDRQALREALLKYKRLPQHWAPFAHPVVQLRLRMPMFMARQYVKHQVGGVWSEESRRYVSDDPTYFFEPEIQGRPKNIKQGAGGRLTAEAKTDARLLMSQTTKAANESYLTLLALGVAPEQAREILPLNTFTGVTWTGSLLFWSRVVTQRVDPHAQGASQELGKRISDCIQPIFPVSWKELTGIEGLFYGP